MSVTVVCFLFVELCSLQQTIFFSIRNIHLVAEMIFLVQELSACVGFRDQEHVLKTGFSGHFRLQRLAPRKNSRLTMENAAVYYLFQIKKEIGYYTIMSQPFRILCDCLCYEYKGCLIHILLNTSFSSTICAEIELGRVGYG